MNTVKKKKSLTVNLEKTKIMVLGKRKSFFYWKQGEVRVVEVDRYKHLGMWFDRKLNWKDHLVIKNEISFCSMGP